MLCSKYSEKMLPCSKYSGNKLPRSRKQFPPSQQALAVKECEESGHDKETCLRVVIVMNVGGNCNCHVNVGGGDMDEG